MRAHCRPLDGRPLPRPALCTLAPVLLPASSAPACHLRLPLRPHASYHLNHRAQSAIIKEAEEVGEKADEIKAKAEAEQDA